MGSFEIDFKGSAEKDLRKIDQQSIPKILNAIEALTEDPFPTQSRKLTNTESSYRLTIGDYRVIYQVDAARKYIVIYHIRHRKDAYRK